MPDAPTLLANALMERAKTPVYTEVAVYTGERRQEGAERKGGFLQFAARSVSDVVDGRNRMRIAYRAPQALFRKGTVIEERPSGEFDVFIQTNRPRRISFQKSDPILGTAMFLEDDLVPKADDWQPSYLGPLEAVGLEGVWHVLRLDRRPQAKSLYTTIVTAVGDTFPFHQRLEYHWDAKKKVVVEVQREKDDPKTFRIEREGEVPTEVEVKALIPLPFRPPDRLFSVGSLDRPQTLKVLGPPESDDPRFAKYRHLKL